MKNVFKTLILLFLLLSFNEKSFAQYPFYGFELSNYEVGDTLEYYHSTLNVYGSTVTNCNATDLYVIINKKIFAGNDSIMYSIRFLHSYECNYTNGVFKVDTLNIVINNDTIYNNRNNLLGILLSGPDTIGAGNIHFDSLYVSYDTVKGLKELKMDEQSVVQIQSFEAVQNMGIISGQYITEDQVNNWGVDLIYAHLANYGIYGTYQYISDGVNNPLPQQTNISIRYDNGGNTYLFYSSNENFGQPILAVYDLLGRIVETQSVNIGSNLINMDNLSAGIYLYKVSSGENMLGQGKLFLLKNNL